MPDTRRHRGAHPEDATLFAAATIPTLRSAVEEFSWLLSKGYAEDSSLALVGNRHGLRERQRMAVRRAACSDADRATRERKREPPALTDGPLGIDGYNVLIGIETALSGGPVFRCRDGSCRDLASIHGTYRRVEETLPALTHIVDRVCAGDATHVDWYLDRPVSNSGRLKALLAEVVEQRHVVWNIELVDDPDRVLAAYQGVVASSDSWILDRCAAWTDLAGDVIRADIPSAWIIDLA